MNTSRLSRLQPQPATGLALAALLLAASLPAWADGPYRCVDPATGKVTISDTPIPGTRQQPSGGYVTGDGTATATAPGDPATPRPPPHPTLPPPAGQRVVPIAT